MWWQRRKSSTTVNSSLDVGQRIGRGLPNDKDTITKRTQTEDWTDKGINTRESNAIRLLTLLALISFSHKMSVTLSRNTRQWSVHRYLNWVQEYQIVSAHVTELSIEFYEWPLLNVHWKFESCSQDVCWWHTECAILYMYA